MAAEKASRHAPDPARKVPPFEDVVRQYYGRVFRVALHITGKRPDAEDVCQEVFLYLCQHLHEFRGEAALFTWIYRITRSAAFRALRKRGVGPLSECEDIPAPPPGESPAETGEKQEAIRRAFALLPDNPRTVASLHLLEGIPLKDIAELLETPEGTVRWWLFKAREILRHWLRSWMET